MNAILKYKQHHPLRIVYLTPALYSAGGIERVVATKANFFAERLGYDVTVIVTEGKGRNRFFPMSDRIEIINYELHFERLWQLPFLKKVFVYLCKQWEYKRRIKTDLMRIRPDFFITTLRREINFITKINDGSIKIGELHVNRANYRNFDSRNSNILKRWFARLWMNNLLGHLRHLDKMVVLTDNAVNDWPELSNVFLLELMTEVTCLPSELFPLGVMIMIRVMICCYRHGQLLKSKCRSGRWIFMEMAT